MGPSLAGEHSTSPYRCRSYSSTGEHFGLVFAKADPLVTCVNKALTTLKDNGTLAALQKRYLQIYLRVPTIQP